MLFVLRDRELSQIAQFQDTAFAHRVASDLPDFDLSLICRALNVRHLRLEGADSVSAIVRDAFAAAREGPVVVEVAFDNTYRTFFTRGVVRTNFGRLPWLDRLRFIGRALGRRMTPG